MNYNEYISLIDKEISNAEKHTQYLKNKKEKFNKLFELYPEASIQNSNICLPNIWDKITCMRIETNNYKRNTHDLQVRFFMGKNKTIEGMKVYTNPMYNKVATIEWRPSNPNTKTVSRKEITIFDYKSLIPIECKRRRTFIKRIKTHLVKLLSNHKLHITENSFEKEEFQRLMLLR